LTIPSPDLENLGCLVDALTPWLDQVVIIGGWAHRLYRFHPLAQPLDYPPLMTLDADIALPGGLRVKGQDMHERLVASGFQAEFLGHHKPPATHLSAEGPEWRFLCRVSHTLNWGRVRARREEKRNDAHRWCGFPTTSVRRPSTCCPLDDRPVRLAAVFPLQRGNRCWLRIP
jgi:hypothetical protein